jgi:hypothetical protein
MTHSAISPVKTEWIGDNLKVTAYVKHRKLIQWWFLTPREANLIRKTFRSPQESCWN